MIEAGAAYAFGTWHDERDRQEVAGIFRAMIDSLITEQQRESARSELSRQAQELDMGY